MLPAGTCEAACAVVKTPCTNQGWRPISVTYQPEIKATQPAKVMATKTMAVRLDRIDLNFSS